MIFAHGVGERGDLPLPLYLFAWGLGLALVVSFFALGVLWTEPRLERVSAGHKLASGKSLTVPLAIFRSLGFVIYLLCLLAALFGTNQPSQNLMPVTFYVVIWVGAQLIGGLIGDIWRVVNPIATLAQGAEALGTLIGRPRTQGPTSWGHWPATIGLFIFLFYELSHPTGARPRTLAWVVLAHAVSTIFAGMAWGAEWVVEHEPFSVFFAKIGAMAPLFFEEGNLRVRWPMSGLSRMPVKAGSVALVLTAIGGTSFDGFSESEFGREIFGDYFDWGLAGWETVGLLLSIGVVVGLYALAIAWTHRVTNIGFMRAWREFAPSLVPIAFGYAGAHYFQLFSDEVQSFVFRLSDPFGQGWNLLGVAADSRWLIDTTAVAWIQVGAMLIGHVGAVTVAHDRAVDIFPVGKSLQSQFAMLIVMVAYSCLGLLLLLTA